MLSGQHVQRVSTVTGNCLSSTQYYYLFVISRHTLGLNTPKVIILRIPESLRLSTHHGYLDRHHSTSWQYHEATIEFFYGISVPRFAKINKETSRERELAKIQITSLHDANIFFLLTVRYSN